MKINAQLVRSEREKRAWSQEHLASVSGLGVRTIHRVEKEGLASPESVKALAAAFDLNISDLTVFDHSVTVPDRLGWLVPILETIVTHAKAVDRAIMTMKTYKRLAITLSLLLVSVVCYLIDFRVGTGVFLVAGFCFELLFWTSLISRPHLTISLSLLIAAPVCYFIGFEDGFRLFLIAGVCFELLFWMSLFSYRRARRLQRAAEFGEVVRSLR